MAKKNVQYVDGFVIPVPKKKVAEYRRLAKIGCKLWMKHGALSYHECVGDDLAVPCGLPFPKGIKTKPAETVFFSFITYKSRAHRNQVNAAVMKDPALTAGMDPKKMPFDVNRMMYGGFKVVVGA
jgi:uncharacterized protein YbaA (DUF1428 family)